MSTQSLWLYVEIRIMVEKRIIYRDGIEVGILHRCANVIKNPEINI